MQLKYTESHKSFLMHAENRCQKWMAKFWGEIYLMNLCPHYILYELNPLYFHLNKYIQKSKQIFSFAVGLLSIQKQMWILWIDLLITPWDISSDFTYAFCSTTLSRAIKKLRWVGPISEACHHGSSSAKFDSNNRFALIPVSHCSPEKK